MTSSQKAELERARERHKKNPGKMIKVRRCIGGWDDVFPVGTICRTRYNYKQLQPVGKKNPNWYGMYHVTYNKAISYYFDKVETK